MKNRLLILGAGGLGREVFSYLHQHPHPEREIAGFLDDDTGVDQGLELPVGVVGGIKNYAPRAEDVFIPAIGNPRLKLEVCHILRGRGGKFISFIHPTAIIGYLSKVGEGVFIFPGAIVGPYATIGDFASIGGNATVGHDAVVGTGCSLSGHAEINGWSVLEEGVFMGSHAAVLPKVKVGAYATVGAGSVAFSAVKPGATVVGVPAKSLDRH